MTKSSGRRGLGAAALVLIILVVVAQQFAMSSRNGRVFMNCVESLASISKEGNAAQTAVGPPSQLFMNEPPRYGSGDAATDVVLFIFGPSGDSSVTYVEQAVLSARTAGYSKRHIVIIDTSYDTHALRSTFLRNQTAYIHQTNPFDLTFSMLQNVAWQLAKEWGFPYYFWMHADVVITSAGETKSMFSRAIEEVDKVQRMPDPWGVLFFSYDWFAAYKTLCTETVRWDQGIPHYFADCDYYNRVQLAGYSVNRAWVGHVLHMRTLLGEDEGRHERQQLMERPIEWWGERGAYQSKNMDIKRRMHSTAANKLAVSATKGFESVGGVNDKQIGSNATVARYIENAKAGKAYKAQKYGDRLRGKNICGSSGAVVEPLFDINEKSLVSQKTDDATTEDEDSDAKKKYLSLVYNEPVTDAAIFDELEMIYRNTSVGLPLHMIPCIVFPYGHNCAKFWKRKCSAGSRSDSSQDITLLAEVNWPTKKNIVGDNEWLEVTRWGMPEGDGYGCFFNVRKGSGVFVNTAKTIVVQDDTDAKNTFRMPSNATWARYCPYARERGYDTIQVVNAVDGKSNQLLYCTGTCATEPVMKACIPGVEFRTGFNHDKPCECDDSMPLINCGSAIAPKGKQHICDQKWIDESSSSSTTTPSVFSSTAVGGGKITIGKVGKIGLG